MRGFRDRGEGRAAPVLVGVGANLRRPGLGPAAGVPGLVLPHLARAGLRPLRLSRLYRSRPAPGGLGPSFVNGVAEVATRLSPADALRRLHAIERRFGRRRRARNAPRPLDLDLLAWGAGVRAGGAPPELPHPRIERRPFVLRPLLDVAPRWRHPATGRPARALLAALRGARGLRRLPAGGPAWARSKALKSPPSRCRPVPARAGSRAGPALRRRMPWHV